jgi:hypothetical protein
MKEVCIVSENNPTENSIVVGEENPFGVGEQNFENIICEKGVYVDKTDLIHRMISGSWSYVPKFLSRPRRFGKTLLLDTIQKVFEGRRELFSGLAIENLMGDRWDVFPVIRISLNTCKTDSPELLEESLLGAVQLSAFQNHMVLAAKNSSSAMAELIVRLSVNHRNDWIEKGKDPSRINRGNVVVLIDEYDYPLIGRIGDPKGANNFRTTLRDFFSNIKGNSQFLRFVFITGITKFREMSLFSAMNTTLDITLDPSYARICGFKIDEIEKSFSQYLDPALSALKQKGQLGIDASVKDLLQTLSKWYNGYTWDGKTEVLNPLSVLKFFQNNEFGNYWYQSGSSLLTSQIAKNGADYFRVFSKDLSFQDSLPEMHINKLNNTVLLMQAGYLTVSGISGTGTAKQYQLKIPNYEIRDSIRIELLTHMLVRDTNDTNIIQHLNEKYLNLLHAFAIHDEANCEFFLSTILAGIIQCGTGILDSDDSTDALGSPGISGSTARTGKSVVKIDSVSPGEYFFRTIFQLLLEFGNKSASPEQFSDIGRSDLVVQVPGNGWVVIEIKHEKADPAHKGSDVSFSGETIAVGKPSKYVRGRLEKMISAAFSQIINKNYAKKYLSDGVDVYAVAMAVYGTSDVMVRFKKVVWAGGGKRRRS